MSSQSQQKQEGLDPFLVGLAIFFLAPLGLYLLWRHPVLKHQTKWWLCACGWILFLLIVGIFDEDEQSGSGGQVTSETRTTNTRPSSTSFGPMRERGRGGLGADRAVQGLIDQGNYDSSTEKTIRDMMEDARRRDGKQ
jgi:hypothetical protein